MADLGGGPTASTARTHNGGGTRLAPGGSDQPGRVMTPTDIMARRRERELRRAQAEEAERRRLSAERRAAAAGVAGGGDRGSRRSAEQPEAVATTPQRGSGGSGQQPDPSQYRPVDPRVARRSMGESNLPQPTGSGRSRAQPATSSTQPRPVVSTSTRQPTATPAATTQPPTTQAKPAPTATGQDRDSYTQSKPQPTQTASQPKNGTTSSFPHAFERWEQLSSHWEGLTNYWMKRLDSNSKEINSQPINQQLARQVTDLSAAGANLFHAVVELQRLRASSERKFQRWFFETRSEQERTQDRIAKLEAELQTERDGRVTDARSVPRENAKVEEALLFRRRAEDQLKEMRRELQISRDEARRGWEEIGRMEQAERDRTYSLKRGQPTLVGGVQVVPMPPSGASRERLGESAQPGADTAYEVARSEADTDPYSEGVGSRGEAPQAPPAVPEISVSPQRNYQTSASSAPVTSSRPGATQYSASTTSAPFYQQSGSGTALHEDTIPPRQPEPDRHSYSQSDTFSEEEYEIDEHGRIRRDVHGNPILYRRGPVSEDSDEYVRDELEREQRHRDQYVSGSGVGRGVPTAAPMPPTSGGSYVPPGASPGYGGASNGQTAYTSQAPDYSGAGYGTGYEWSAVPRHHHPTRLSDVLEEEDERSRTSRTSPSRASERSRGPH